MHRSSSRTLRAVLSCVGVPLLLAALALVGLTPGPAAAADNDVPWAVRTASNSFGSDRANYGYTVNPGAQVEDGLVVANRGTTPLDLAVYAADGFTTSAGRLDLATADTPSEDVGAWVHPDRAHVRIQPGESVVVPFTVRVPTNAEPGDHVGGIVTSLTQKDAASGVDVDRRLALRVRLRVSGELRPSLAVGDLRVHYAGTANPFGKGDAVLSYTIHNTGNTVLAARQTASVAGPLGRWKVRAERIKDSPELLPGETWKVSVSVRGVTPALRLTATVTLLPLLKDAAGSTGTLASVESGTHIWTVPWTILALVGLCSLVVAILVARRRRRPSRVLPRVSEPSTSGSTGLAPSVNRQ